MVHFLRIDSLIAVIYLLKEVGKITRFNPFLVRLSRASNEKKKKTKADSVNNGAPTEFSIRPNNMIFFQCIKFCFTCLVKFLKDLVGEN